MIDDQIRKVQEIIDWAQAIIDDPTSTTDVVEDATIIRDSAEALKQVLIDVKERGNIG